MARLAVRTSASRLALRGLAGLILLVAAADVLWLHIVSDPPEAGADGLLTARGANAQRLDFIWGSTMAVGGAVLVVWAGAGLSVRRELLVVGPDGLEVQLGRSGDPPTFIAWEHVRSVRSTVFADETGATPALEVVIDDADGVPELPAGAVWDGDRLLVDAEGWDVRAVDVAVHARLALERVLRPPDGEGADGAAPYA